MSILDFIKEKFSNPDPRIRLSEVEKLTDAQQLATVAKTDDSPRVRLAAVARITDDDVLADIAINAKEIDVRLAAVERINSEEILANIIKIKKNYQLMGACFAKISDRKVLEKIANDTDYNPAARRMAIDQFADESYLDDISKASSEQDSEERKSDEAIQALLDNYGDIRVVRAIGRFNRSEKAIKALGTISQKGGESGGLAVEYLCKALGSSNTDISKCAADELANLTDPEQVDILIRSLDNPNLEKPVRDVLEHIDTQKARKALDNE